MSEGKPDIDTGGRSTLSSVRQAVLLVVLGMSLASFVEPFLPGGSWQWLTMILVVLAALFVEWWWPRFLALSRKGRIRALAITAVGVGVFLWLAPMMFPGVPDTEIRLKGGARPDVRLEPEEVYAWFDHGTIEVQVRNYGDRVAELGYVTAQANMPGAPRIVLPFQALAPGETRRFQTTLVDVFRYRRTDFGAKTGTVAVSVGGCYVFEGANFLIGGLDVRLRLETKEISASRGIVADSSLAEKPPESCLARGPNDIIMSTPLSRTQRIGE
ncbi:MAG TPA: hypothetical protein VLF66_14810 [Thermoanaerobaculia bacterium]|nr:hypothetical protein [Thermoanaerobaculia bacterium]